MNEKPMGAIRISGNSPTVFYDAAGNEYPVADRPVTVEHVGQDVWEVSLTLICQDVEVLAHAIDRDDHQANTMTPQCDVSRP
jgi:hypothetical protein|nr:MAG TPA: hypothetical protein [Caudoviricetes sp.]